MDPIELKINHIMHISAPVDLVWDFLIDEEKMKALFQAKVFIINDMEGGRIEVPAAFDDEEYLAVGEVGLVVPQSRLIFSWAEKNLDGVEWFNNTFVEINLAEEEGGVQLDFSHYGFKHLPYENKAQIVERYIEYWTNDGILDQLKTRTEAETVLEGN